MKTLDTLRQEFEKGPKPSRFHKSLCPDCLQMVTNQAMGRKAHMDMHKRQKSTVILVEKREVGGWMPTRNPLIPPQASFPKEIG